MTTQEILQILCTEIHTVVIASLDEHGLPQTCVIDLMLADEEGLYFLTAKGKSFYRRLAARNFVSLSGMKGGDSLSATAITVRGVVRNIGKNRLSEIFAKNPYMAKIYPTAASREALEVFHLYKGQGEYFDLTRLPPFRHRFVFGGERGQCSGYRIIAEKCISCRNCINACPVSCIRNTNPRSIDSAHCLHCGNCLTVCSAGAVERIDAANPTFQ